MQQGIEEIKKYVKSVLSEKRFAHTVNVAEEAKRLARIWGADEESAYIAGLVHDMAKEKPFDEAFAMLRQYGYIPDEAEQKSPALLHAPLAAFMAEEKFGITDADVLGAVRFHTTGRCRMSLLEKIIYVADFAEEGRPYPQAREVREIAYRDIDRAVLFQADAVIKFVIDRGGILHNNTVAMRNYYLTKNKRG